MKDDFYEYRLRRGYSAKSIKSQDSYLRGFTSWLAGNGLCLEQMNTQTILSFISHERKKGAGSANLRNRLQAIRVYLDYQVAIHIVIVNPATGILQDRQHTLLFPPMEEETLQDIYKIFVAK